MKTRNAFILLASVLILATVACSAVSSLFSTNPTAANFYMATDQTGNTHTTSYGVNDDFYVFFDVSNIPVGTQFQAKWYALDVSGQDPNTPFQTTNYAYESGVSQIYFQLTNNGAWPTGHYRVEIYMSGNKIGEQSFTVQ
jgi:archaellum component FlaF (FlaF/FlaG flagellin family)